MAGVPVPADVNYGAVQRIGGGFCVLGIGGECGIDFWQANLVLWGKVSGILQFRVLGPGGQRKTQITRQRRGKVLYA